MTTNKGFGYERNSNMEAKNASYFQEFKWIEIVVSCWQKKKKKKVLIVSQKRRQTMMKTVIAGSKTN